MSTNPSKDRLFLQAFTTGISKTKKPDKIEYELYSRSSESGIFLLLQQLVALL
jgi:hypothetical protein